MYKIIFLSAIATALGSSANAQDVELAKKAINAEQFEKAKGILKSAIATNPDNGKLDFLLGNIYLQQSLQDSAKIYFDKGLTTKVDANYNFIGLGELDLNNGNPAAAQFNFDQATKDIKKKDIEPFVYIGKAFTHAEKPDYKKAILNLNKAKAVNPTNAEMLMAFGDAYYLDHSQNDAYASYSSAYDADKSLIRAKMQLGVLLKEAKAFQEAVNAFDGVIALDSNYGPVYRELAETYFQWGFNDKPKYKEYTAKSLGFYEKYMSLTDYSLASRMRHAEFLIVAKDYVALEKEANEMKKLDKVNPRILRYLGYAAYENGNIAAAISALNEYIANPTNKVIGRDYLYLGLSKLKDAVPVPVADSKEKVKVNDALFNQAIADIKKAVELDKPMANDLNDIGKKLFDQKLYKYAAAIYEIAVSNPKSKNYLYDNFYLGYALYFENSGKLAGEKVNVEELKKANAAFANVITSSPTTQDAYIYQARVNALLQNDTAAQEQMAKSYEGYIKVLMDKGAIELDKPANKTKLVEAYQNLALFFKKDKPKALEFITKALVINPTDTDSLNIQKALK